MPNEKIFKARKELEEKTGRFLTFEEEVIFAWAYVKAINDFEKEVQDLINKEFRAFRV